jgi:hypothetical protein
MRLSANLTNTKKVIGKLLINRLIKKKRECVEKRRKSKNILYAYMSLEYVTNSLEGSDLTLFVRKSIKILFSTNSQIR